MPPIRQGQTFPTLQDFKNALRDWAIERNWTPHILDSDSHRVRAGCRSSPDCPFRVRANYSIKRGDAKVTTCDGNHTCEPFRASAEGRPHQAIKRAETGKLKFLLEAVPKLMTVTLDTNITEIIEAVERKYGQKIPTRQAQKVKAGLTDRVKGPCRHCHQLGHTRRHCPQLPSSVSGPMDFSNLHQSISKFTHENGGDGAHAGGGLELDNGEDSTLCDTNPVRGNQRLDGHSPVLPQAANLQATNASQLAHLQPGRTSVDRGLATQLQQFNSQGGPTSEPSPLVPNPRPVGQPVPAQTQQGPQTPQQARLEAARLMQQAAGLMQEAARLNAEAARLTASVANS